MPFQFLNTFQNMLNFNIDIDILNFIQENMRNPVLDFLMKWITYLGNGGFIWILIALIFLMTKKYRYNGFMIAGALTLCLLIGNFTLKPLIARLRPCDINPDIILLIKRPTDFSFPSGHSLSSFASATVIFYTDKRYGISAFILAALIAFSRLYLYVHYPSDVFVGLVLGIVIGLISIYTALKIKPKIDKKLEIK